MSKVTIMEQENEELARMGNITRVAKKLIRGESKAKSGYIWFLQR